MKQADPTDVQAQDLAGNEVPVAEDTSEQQAQVSNTDSQVDEEQQDPDIPETRHLEHHKMIIMELPSMMMSRMTQYNSAIQLPNHSCQEVSENPLQR